MMRPRKNAIDYFDHSMSSLFIDSLFNQFNDQLIDQSFNAMASQARAGLPALPIPERCGRRDDPHARLIVDCEIIIAKQRNGPIFDANVLFDLSVGAFRDQPGAGPND